MFTDLTTKTLDSIAGDLCAPDTLASPAKRASRDCDIVGHVLLHPRAGTRLAGPGAVS